MRHLHAVQAQAHVAADDRAAGQDGHILQQGLSAFPETGRFDGHTAKSATHLVDHQGRQCLTVNIFRYDYQGPAALCNHHFHGGDDVGGRAKFLIGDQEEGIVQRRFHTVGVGDKVGRKIAPVYPDTFYDFQFVVHGFGFLDGDDALPANFVHGVGQ